MSKSFDEIIRLGICDGSGEVLPILEKNLNIGLLGGHYLISLFDALIIAQFQKTSRKKKSKPAGTNSSTIDGPSLSIPILIEKDGGHGSSLVAQTTKKNERIKR
jgi:hypothetical protein